MVQTFNPLAMDSDSGITGEASYEAPRCIFEINFPLLFLYIYIYAL